jgi:hypothetical protein
MMFAMVFMKFEYGEMSKYEKALEVMNNASDEVEDGANANGRVIDLLLPIIVLIVMCILGMIYTGGFFTKFNVLEDGTTEANGNFLNIISSFSDSDASVGLVLGSFAALIITIIFYVCRKVLSFKGSMLSIIYCLGPILKVRIGSTDAPADKVKVVWTLVQIRFFAILVIEGVIITRGGIMVLALEFFPRSQGRPVDNFF